MNEYPGHEQHDQSHQHHARLPPLRGPPSLPPAKCIQDGHAAVEVAEKIADGEASGRQLRVAYQGAEAAVRKTRHEPVPTGVRESAGRGWKPFSGHRVTAEPDPGK
jgi:hypothetical protein